MRPLNVMLLAGGPDRERAVSLMAADQVAAALRTAGHVVEQHDIGPDDLSALDRFAAWPGDVVLPLLHGPWGEGGPLQEQLDRRGISYVGSRADAAGRCMDKYQTKQLLDKHQLPTPPYELLSRGCEPTLAAPLVIKALREGSSLDLFICKEKQQVTSALQELFTRHDQLLLEQYIAGRELTVGMLGNFALPVIEIVAHAAFYDYDAKYTRDDTQYLFDTDVPDIVSRLAIQAHQALGCRHLSRVDFMLDADNQPWMIEVNTMPGFTSHSLLPMAAARAGVDMPALLDRLVRMGAGLSDD